MTLDVQHLVPRSSAWQKWAVTLKTVPFVAVITLLKFVADRYGLEVMELNALLTSLVAGTIFLVGFLISGVLADYKESERLPSDLAASLNTLFDDTVAIGRHKPTDATRRLLAQEKLLTRAVLDWFFRQERTRSLQEKISLLSEVFADLDRDGVHPAYLTKLKTEQSALRKLVLRIDTIRDTAFVGSAYTIVEVMAFVVSVAMVLTKIEPFYTGLFFTVIVAFLILYMLFLIRDLDDPFDYRGHGEGGTEIPLKPLRDLQAVLESSHTP